MRIIFSLVLYKHSFSDIEPLLESISNLYNSISETQYKLALYIFDNSVERSQSIDSKFFKSFPFEISYFLSNKNFGFGVANNENFKRASITYEDILIISNPDTSFSNENFLYLISWLAGATDVACVAPLIKDANGNIQFSAKKNPTILSLMLGRFHCLKSLSIFENYDFNHKNKNFDYTSELIDSTYLSGCFLFVKGIFYLKVGGFCNKYFLHLEDADLVRRLAKFGRTIHNPKFTIKHLWARGSHKSYFQMYHLIRSMLIYFFLWGVKIF